MWTAMDLGPYRSRNDRSRAAMSDSASSHDTGSNSPGPPTRLSGWRIRSGSFCTSAMAMPLVQQNPLEWGLSLSARSEVSLPSSTVATRPHNGSQMRQNVTFSSTIGLSFDRDDGLVLFQLFQVLGQAAVEVLQRCLVPTADELGGAGRRAIGQRLDRPLDRRRHRPVLGGHGVAQDPPALVEALALVLALRLLRDQEPDRGGGALGGIGVGEHGPELEVVGLDHQHRVGIDEEVGDDVLPQVGAVGDVVPDPVELAAGHPEAAVVAVTVPGMGVRLNEPANTVGVEELGVEDVEQPVGHQLPV